VVLIIIFDVLGYYNLIHFMEFHHQSTRNQNLNYKYLHHYCYYCFDCYEKIIIFSYLFRCIF